MSKYDLRLDISNINISFFSEITHTLNIAHVYRNLNVIIFPSAVAEP